MIIFQRNTPIYRLALAEIHPEEHFYLENLQLNGEERSELDSITNLERRMEWLAVRHLLHQLTGTGNRLHLEKDSFGKPHFAGKRVGLLSHCSISHSKDFVAAMISTVPCGCDVQYISKATQRIAQKFLSESEEAMLNRFFPSEKLRNLNAVWSVKESLYKTYGRKELEFKKHIMVQLKDEKNALGLVQKADFNRAYQIELYDFLKETEAYVLSWCIEK